MAESLREKSKKAFAWSAVENILLQVISFVSLIFMSRMLTPADYGLVGMIAIFTAVSGTLVQSGFPAALVRKQNRTEKDLSSTFYFNIVLAVFFYLVLFFGAPLIADFYNEPRLVSITRVSALSLIVGGLSSVQSTLYAAKLDFKTTTKASVTATILSCIIGMSMAYYGFGVWAILTSSLANSVVSSSILWFYSTWRPKWIFSWSSIKELFGFGSKLMLSSLLDTIYGNLTSLLIGKVYSASILGHFARANSIATLPSTNLTSVMQRVTYPMLCTIQEDNDRLSSVYRRLLKLSAFVIFPLMVGLSALSKPIILTLLSERWLFSATLMQIICFSLMWYPIHSINLNLLKVKGRSDLFFRLEVIKKIIGVTMLAICVPLGIKAMCVGSVVSSLIALFINTYYTGKLINVTYFMQIKDLMPTLVLSLVMGGCVYLTISLINLSEILKVLIGISEGIVIYIGIAKILNFAEFNEAVELFLKKR